MPNAVPEQQLSLEQVLQFIQSLAENGQSSERVHKELDSLRQKNKELEDKNQELQREIAKTKQDNSIIEEDYQSLIQIMNRARRMAILEDEESVSNSTFKMDKNGNLEKVAK